MTDWMASERFHCPVRCSVCWWARYYLQYCLLFRSFRFRNSGSHSVARTINHSRKRHSTKQSNDQRRWRRLRRRQRRQWIKMVFEKFEFEFVVVWMRIFSQCQVLRWMKWRRFFLWENWAITIRIETIWRQGRMQGAYQAISMIQIRSVHFIYFWQDIPINSSQGNYHSYETSLRKTDKKNWSKEQKQLVRY